MHTQIALHSSTAVAVGHMRPPGLAVLLCIRNGAIYM